MPKERKEKKDVNAPKRGKTAFLFYCDDHRDTVKKANPDAKMTDLSKILGEQWGKLSDSQKKKYNDLAQADKDRYNREMASYKPPAISSSGSKKSKKGTAGAGAGAGAAAKAAKAKRPASGFNLFLKETRPIVVAAHPGMAFGEISTEVGRRWKALSDSEREAWKAKGQK